MARMLGYGEDALTGLDFEGLVHGEDIDVDKHLLTSLISGEIPTYVVPKRFIRADGNIMYGSVTVSVARELDQSGNIILVVQDITHSKQQENKIASQHEALMHRERVAAIGSMLAGVAHELNNPLTGVLTFSHLVRKNLPDDSRDAEDLDLVIRETKRCAAIIRRLLDFSREKTPEKGQFAFNNRCFEKTEGSQRFYFN